MTLRNSWILLCVFCLGCQSILGVGENDVRMGAEAIVADGRAGKKEPERSNHLSAAAKLLERGDDAGACQQLEKYLESHPEHLQVRSYLAELLLEQQRTGEARIHLEHYIAAAQKDEGTLRDRIQCHCRLMEIAEEAEDPYRVHLHRGIGMYLLALRRAGLPEPEGEIDLNCEGLLCKAAAELVHAASLNADEARPCWYLYAIWWRLGQQHTAHEWLARANEAAGMSYLTPCEQRQLVLATSAARIGGANEGRFVRPSDDGSRAPRVFLGLPSLSLSLPRTR